MRIHNLKLGGATRKRASSSMCHRYAVYLTSMLVIIMLVEQNLSFSSMIVQRLNEDSNVVYEAVFAEVKCTKFQNIAMDLEETAKATAAAYRYYVYDSTNMTIPKIRKKTFDSSAKPGEWGRKRWTSRFKEYARGELRFLQALEEHKLRTRNISEAAFIIVPIPLGPTIFWGKKSHFEKAFTHLFNNEPHFRSHPEKHVFITNNERLFRSDHESVVHFARSFGFTPARIQMLNRSILVKDYDLNFFEYHINNSVHQLDWPSSPPSLFKKSWSLGWAHEASIPEFMFEMVSFDGWSKKPFHFFYHSRTSMSMNNSTIYRHALLLENTDGNNSDILSHRKQLIQPSSVGFDIRHDRWIHDYANSKFCLIIRGDAPGSRALYRAIRQGCLPVIVSDTLPYFQPMFRSMLKFQDFTVMVPERDFLENPAQALNKATTTDMSDQELRSKLEGLALVQRILVLDHPASLFVPAFVRETLASQQASYYDFGSITV